MGTRTAAALLDLLKTAAQEWMNDNTFRLAASLAFYMIFSLAPILLIAVWISGLIFGEEEAARHMVSQVEMLVGRDGAEAASQALKGARRAGGGPIAAIVGIGTLLVGSTVVFAELQSALNHIWDVKPSGKRGTIWSLIRTRVLSFALVLAVGFLLLVSLVISAVLAGVQEYVQSRLGDAAAWRWVNLGGSLLVVTVLFGLIYKVLPDAKIAWRDVTIGAVVTALLFTAGKFAIGAYLGRAAVGSAYGAAGSFVVLLIWMYYSALICFFGAEFTQVFARRYGSRIHPEEHAERTGEKPDTV